MAGLDALCRKFAIRSCADLRAPAPVDAANMWPADSFRLPATTFWRDASPDIRKQVLARCAVGLLHEALGIERTAMDYCAQRILNAQDAVEKQIYSLTAADEARHFHWLCSLTDPATATAPPDAFTRFLQRLVREGSVHSQSYMLQIILEGWGIAHYQRLASQACETDVARVMSRIARDEGLHYAAGVAHFDARQLSGADRGFIRAGLAELCRMLACGPLAVLRVVEETAQGFSATERSRTFAALTDGAAIADRLRKLARFIAQAEMASEAAWLAEQDLLVPLPGEVALRFYDAP